jgi:heat shock protein HslJ
MKKIIIMLSLAVFMASCASNSSSNNRTKNIAVSQNAKVVLADKTSDEKVICKQTKRTGSNRIITVCRSQSEIDAITKQTQSELLRKSNQTNNSSIGN